MKGAPQVVRVLRAAGLSAKESFTSRLTSEPAIQWRRHELAGISNVSAQSELLLSHCLTHSLALWPLSPCHLQSQGSEWHPEEEVGPLTTPPASCNLHSNRPNEHLLWGQNWFSLCILEHVSEENSFRYISLWGVWDAVSERCCCCCRDPSIETNTQLWLSLLFLCLLLEFVIWMYGRYFLCTSGFIDSLTFANGMWWSVWLLRAQKKKRSLRFLWHADTLAHCIHVVM